MKLNRIQDFKKFEKDKKTKKKKKKTKKEKSVIIVNDNDQPNHNQTKIKRKKSLRKNSGSHLVNNNVENNKAEVKITTGNNQFDELKESKRQIKENEAPVININQIKEIENVPDRENDYEMNNLSYIDALKYDKRTCCDYYGSLIKNKQIFVFTFCSFNDYNSGIIKKFIFFLSFALHYTINALFFNDSNMHQIYEDEGKYNFSYQFPKILISTISSTIILRIILQTLVLTDKSILQVKYQPTRDLALEMKKKILKCINIKFAIFFILNFILLVLFWFYLTCFNAKYANTQVYLIENTFISFGISLVYPFIINIIPACLRISSLEDKNKDKSCLYSASQIMQLIFV